MKKREDSMVADKIKIAATRVGVNYPPDNINPDRSDKNLDIEAVKEFKNGNIQRTVAALRMAGEQGADLVLSHEDIMGGGHYSRNELRHVFSEIAEGIPGPTFDMLANIAREYNMYVAACYYEKDNGKFYNTDVLIGRGGEIVGKYRKIHLPGLERWLISPGFETPVFKTDIGNIGIGICYDIAFPEQMRSLALNGADIILHPTVGWGFVYGENDSMGEALARVRAAENQCYLIYAKNYPGGKSCIVANDGVILAENASTDKDGIVIAEFEPDYDLMKANSYWSFLANMPSIRARMLYERRPDSYGALTKKVPDVIRERYSEYKFSGDNEEITREIGELWDQWRQGKINLPYIWE
jgi:predicted amidohydrolase